jgi:hypothetical protein
VRWTRYKFEVYVADLQPWTAVYNCSSQKIISKVRQPRPLHVEFWLAAIKMDISMEVEQEKVEQEKGEQSPRITLHRHRLSRQYSLCPKGQGEEAGRYCV